MPTELVKSVPIMLDKERHLRLTLGAMKRFKTASGVDLLKGFKGDEIITVENVSALLWSCLVTEDSSLTIEQIDGMIDFSNIYQYINIITQLFNEHLPEKKEGDLKNPSDAQTG